MVWRFHVSVALAAICFATSFAYEGPPVDMKEQPHIQEPRSIFNEAAKCPACCVYAAALRRASWELHPKFEERLAPDARRKHLVQDDRVENVVAEALDIVLTHYVQLEQFDHRFAPWKEALRLGAVNDSVIEWRNDLEQWGGDTKLLSFIHEEMANIQGDEVEALAARDLMKGHIEADFALKPTGVLCDADNDHACATRISTLVILKDAAADDREVTKLAEGLCQKQCSGRDVHLMVPLSPVALAHKLGRPLHD